MSEARTDEHKVAVVARLLEMARGPHAPLVGVWWDDGRPRVKYALWADFHVLSWSEAEEMTGVYWDEAEADVRKPMGRLLSLAGAKRSAA